MNTEFTELFGVKYPILLAGMNVAAGPLLAASVTNAGGVGVIGGMNYSPDKLRNMIKEMKSYTHPNPVFGVDLLLPQIGSNARKTNKDYTNGKLSELIDVIIESGARLFVSAVGVPSKDIVDRLHAHNILCMNMVGNVRHVKKALAVGMDLICAQGYEGGGHTGDIGTMVLIPAVVDACKGHVSPLTGKPVIVVGAGGIYDGRTFTACLALGANAAWIGTRFVASYEASATKQHKNMILATHHDETMRTLVYTGRPLRIAVNHYATEWETYRHKQMHELLRKGIIPCEYDINNYDTMTEDEKQYAREARNMRNYPLLMGQVSGSISKLMSAQDIVDSIIKQSIEIIESQMKTISQCKHPQTNIYAESIIKSAL